MPPHEGLTELEQLVMLSVIRLRDSAYAAAVRRDLAEAASRRISAATVHVTLVRLERRGLLDSWESKPEPVRGGRSRRCFEMTPEGVSALRDARDVMDRMWARVRGYPQLGEV
ncbi:MAG: helix-turn-helix transcriptional regulator [Gemmatimonadota bacterium]|nr:helix-turn-helix transcriptional regulator [Gemmatimonadota bacterium]